MRFNHTLSALLRGIWLLDPSWAELHAPLAFQLLAGESDLNLGTPEPESESDVNPVQLATYGFKVGRYTSLDRLPHGSVAIMDLVGPVTRYGGMCGADGLEQKSTLLRQLYAAENISAIVLNANTPGGEASGTASFAQLIRSGNKPVVGFVDDGIAASAGMWIMSACREIYASNKQSSFGSIGAYCTMMDMTAALEAKGIKVHEIYAPQSKDKNKEVRDALEGDYSGIQARLKELVAHFIGDVKANRAGRLNLAAGDPFTGKMFNAVEAKNIGLIDGFMSLEQAIGRAAELAQSPAPTRAKTTTHKMSATKKYGRIAAAAGWPEYETTEEGLHINHDDAAKIEAALEQGATDAAAVAKHAEEISAKDTRISELEQELKTTKEAKEAAESKVAEYAGKAHNQGTTPAAGATDPVEPKAPKAMDEVTAQAMAIYAKNRNKTAA